MALLADWLVHFKYTEEEEAAKMQHCEEVNQSINHVCRDSTVLDPQEVEVVLMEAKLPAPPLIHEVLLRQTRLRGGVDRRRAPLPALQQPDRVHRGVPAGGLPQKTPVVFGKLKSTSL